MLRKIIQLSILFIALFNLSWSTQDIQKKPDYYFATDDYQIHQGIPNQKSNKSFVAFIEYQNTVNEVGWDIIKLQTNPNYNDVLQMKMAGYLEGYVTQHQIFNLYLNFVEGILHGNSTIDDFAHDYVVQQFEWMKQQIYLNPKDHYWQMVEGLLNQVEGMYQGYVKKIKETGKEEEFLPFYKFYYLPNMADLQDLIKNKQFACNSFATIANGKLFVGHSTFNLFPLMLKTFKIYDFKLNNPKVNSHKQSFSSRPADLISKDDFFVIHGTNLVVTETSIINYNETNKDLLSPQTLPVWVRLNVANRFADSAKEWAELFKFHFSGTHNSQWLVVDFNKFEAKAKLGIAYQVESFFNLFKAEDITETLIDKNGFYASYNVPYDKEIYQQSAYEGNYPYNYFNDPRGRLFKARYQQVQDMESFKTFMRQNKNETGDPCQEIGARCDLRTKDQGPFDYGLIDTKLVDSDLMKKERVWIICSPTTDVNLPPFSFTGQWADIPHHGMPDTYDFDWIYQDLKVKPQCKVQQKEQQ